jgi:hypothetical protein
LISSLDGVSGGDILRDKFRFLRIAILVSLSKRVSDFALEEIKFKFGVEDIKLLDKVFSNKFFFIFKRSVKESLNIIIGSIYLLK